MDKPLKALAVEVDFRSLPQTNWLIVTASTDRFESLTFSQIFLFECTKEAPSVIVIV